MMRKLKRQRINDDLKHKRINEKRKLKIKKILNLILKEFVDLKKRYGKKKKLLKLNMLVVGFLLILFFLKYRGFWF